MLTFFNTYNKPITPGILKIQLSNRDHLNPQQLEDIGDYLKELNFVTENLDWLMDSSEKFCKRQAVQNAILNAFDIIEGKDKIHTQDAIPSMLSEALAVSFDKSIGHDYFNDFKERFDFYHREEERIPFDLEIFNKITKGGLPKKSLTIVITPTGGGKSLFMCHLAASTLMQGKNVLYITMEMSEERIAERIDANLLNMTTIDLETATLETYTTKIERLRSKNHGQLIVKEYPEYGAHSGTFQALIDELKIKKNFVPDMLIIDYLNICASSRLKADNNSYTYIKSIAAELRGLGKIYDIPIVSATQTNRAGYDNSDITMSETSESTGLNATADLLFAIMSNEELDNLGQFMIKQLKNRYNDLNYYKRFVIGVDKSKMRLYDAEVSAQKNIVDSGQPILAHNRKPPIGEGFKF